MRETRMSARRQVRRWQQAFAANDMPPVSVVHNGIDAKAWQSVNQSLVNDLRRRLDLE